MPHKRFKTKNIYTALSFLIPFLVYIITLAPGVSWIDSDELTTASSLLKVAHPTGYPLFTILGKIFTLLPFGEKAYMLNIMSAVFSASGAALFFNLMVYFFTKFKFSRSDKSLSHDQADIVIYNISFASALLLAFSKTFWDNANVVEVYSLHSFFLILLIFLFLKANNYYSVEDNTFGKAGKYWLLFSFVLGLSFANHLTTIFLSFGFLYLFFSNYGFNKSSLRHILYLAIPFITGLTLYVYLLIRADNSLLSWGHTFNLDNFIAHVTGRQYNTAMFRSADDLLIQLKRFLSEFPEEFFFINLVLIIPGLIFLFSKSKSIFYFTVILFLSCVLLASNYTIYDIYSYYLLSLVVAAVWMGFGLMFIFSKLKSSKKENSFAVILICLIPLSYNFSVNDKSKDNIVKDYVLNLFNSASENSIIISNYNPTYYFQYVKKVRPDIVFINRDYLYNQWYLDAVIASYPEIYNRSKNKFDNYSVELAKLQDNKSKYLTPKTKADNLEIMKFQNSLRDLLNSIVEKNNQERDVYATLEIDEVNDEKYAEGFKKIPNGVLLKLTSENDFSDYKHIDLNYEISPDEDFFKSYVLNTYYKAYINQVKYLIENSALDGVEELISRAENLKPDSQETRQLSEKVKQLKSNNK